MNFTFCYPIYFQREEETKIEEGSKFNQEDELSDFQYPTDIHDDSEIQELASLRNGNEEDVKFVRK